MHPLDVEPEADGRFAAKQPSWRDARCHRCDAELDHRDRFGAVFLNVGHPCLEGPTASLRIIQTDMLGANAKVNWPARRTGPARRPRRARTVTDADAVRSHFGRHNAHRRAAHESTDEQIGG